MDLADLTVREFADLVASGAPAPGGGSAAAYCGAVGAALCSHCLAQGWIRRIEGSRAVAVTRRGEEALRRHFGIVLT